MSFLEKLDYLMNRDGLNKHTLAQKSGIPYTTIVGFYERGYGNTKLSTIEKLCDFFNVSLDYLMRDSFTNPYTSPDSFSNDEIRLIDAYRCMTKEGKEKVQAYVSDMLMLYQNEKNAAVPVQDTIA
jgi:transcriptional regulator with XRE-family HTH domain